jgi:hypothetical protein
MISPFLKKLLFVRQFIMNGGKIQILGENQVMLPSNALLSLQNENTFEIISKEIKVSMSSYAKKIGSSSGGMLKSVQDIYETMGLGKMRVVKLVADKKQVIVQIGDIKFKDTALVEGVLAGLFSCMFNKSLTRENIKVIKKASYTEISIK